MRHIVCYAYPVVVCYAYPVVARSLSDSSSCAVASSEIAPIPIMSDAGSCDIESSLPLSSSSLSIIGTAARAVACASSADGPRTPPLRRAAMGACLCRCACIKGRGALSSSRLRGAGGASSGGGAGGGRSSIESPHRRPSRSSCARRRAPATCLRALGPASAKRAIAARHSRYARAAREARRKPWHARTAERRARNLRRCGHARACRWIRRAAGSRRCS
mmetsp:Transcript_22202/g.71964  ORF Transcript_22202/g.71964 Transcript_22202/m.71964 type:complete len:219 (-) Transcript_22202:830-1486(-)